MRPGYGAHDRILRYGSLPCNVEYSTFYALVQISQTEWKVPISCRCNEAKSSGQAEYVRDVQKVVINEI